MTKRRTQPRWNWNWRTNNNAYYRPRETDEETWDVYWFDQSEVLFFGLYSEISGGHMPNKVDNGATYLTVAGSAGSETYQCPNTAPYIAADTDYIWFKTDTTQRTTTTAELIGYDLQRTPIKYNDTSPNAIVAIMILNAAVTGNKRDKMFTDFWLPIMWDNSLSAYGRVKDNRGATQQLWPPEILHEAEVITYIEGLVTPLSTGQLILLDTFVAALKSGLSITNLSDYFDVMYILAGETSESSLRNLVKNAHHATLEGTPNPTFTALEGPAGDGTNGYIRTHYNTSSDAVRRSQNDGAYGIYSRTDSDLASGADCGALNVNEDVLYIRAGNVLYQRINTQGGLTAIANNTNSLGLYIASRNGALAANNYTYKNKTTLTYTSNNATSTALTNREVYICCKNNGSAFQFSTRQYSFYFESKFVSTAHRDVIVDAFEAYMDANGKGVI